MYTQVVLLCNIECFHFFNYSTLTEALEKNKRKYQSRIKRLEQQLMTATTTTTNQNQNNNTNSLVTNNPSVSQNRKQPSFV
jgi:hypothetical protein